MHELWPGSTPLTILKFRRDGVIFFAAKEMMCEYFKKRE